MWGLLEMIRGALGDEQVGNHCVATSECPLMSHSHVPDSQNLLLGAVLGGAGAEGPGEDRTRRAFPETWPSKRRNQLAPKSSVLWRSLWLIQAFDSQFLQFVAMTWPPRLLDY